MSGQDELQRLRQQNAELAAALIQVVSLFSEISLKGHKTGYDWNADPESLTLLGSRIFEARYEPEKILSAHDASVRKPLLEENHKLRKIAAFVPADVYIRAKEKAGYGDSVKAHEPTRYNDDGSERSTPTSEDVWDHIRNLDDGSEK